jgi:spermidine dehydrogenase
MHRISRRDFLNGLALTIVPGLTAGAQVLVNPDRYPPALIGLRGQHPGSFEVAHENARTSRRFAIENLPIEESYDLVIVGAGISGLAAAWFFRRAAGPGARILLLDNHDDFGGHAKRNEFTLAGRLLIGYGGSQSIQSPNTLYSPVAKGLLRDLHVNVTRFQDAFDRGFYSSLGLSRGLFFAREAFGRDVLVSADPSAISAGPVTARGNVGIMLHEVVAQFPISAAAKRHLLALYNDTRDPLAGKSIAEKRELLKTISYRDYLIKIWGCSEEVSNCFQGRTLGFFGLGCDAVPAADVRAFGYPGFTGLGLPAEPQQAWDEPYIYHFPDGNASLARLLVRALIPGVAPGDTMDDVVLARFDYGALDRMSQNTRIRLKSTCIDVRNTTDKVAVSYVRSGVAHRIEAKHAVLACFHMVIPYIAPELPESQRQALAQNVKTPLVYTNVLVRNWQAWINLKITTFPRPCRSTIA